jgi:hypothetical protein
MRRNYSWSLVIAGGVLLTALALIGDGRLWSQQAAGDEELSLASSYVSYTLDIGGEYMGTFTSCSGLGMSNEIEYQYLTVPPGVGVERASPGPVKACQITLGSEEPGTPALWQWRRAMDAGGYSAALREGRITMSNGLLEPAGVWVFHKGWPATVMLNEGKLEVVIAHEGLEMVSPGGGSTTPAGRTR